MRELARHQAERRIQTKESWKERKARNERLQVKTFEGQAIKSTPGVCGQWPIITCARAAVAIKKRTRTTSLWTIDSRNNERPLDAD